jgi:Heavy metal associated domain 2
VNGEITINEPSVSKPTHIVSQIPGRVRLRVAHPHRQRERMAQIETAIAAHPQVARVQTNVKTGSLLIHHDPANGGLDNILAMLKDLGIILGYITEKPIVAERSQAAANLTKAIGDLNQRVQKTTDGLVDLRFLFPWGLSLLAVRQLLVKGWQLDLIPWYVLAWYAFDSFVKLNASASDEKKHSLPNESNEKGLRDREDREKAHHLNSLLETPLLESQRRTEEKKPSRRRVRRKKSDRPLEK